MWKAARPQQLRLTPHNRPHNRAPSRAPNRPPQPPNHRSAKSLTRHLLTAHCPLPTAHCPLPTAIPPPPAAHYPPCRDLQSYFSDPVRVDATNLRGMEAELCFQTDEDLPARAEVEPLAREPLDLSR